MYKLFVVDDERIIVDGISRTIDWGSLNVDVAGTARNGIEALERIHSLQPDIVISDIRMPGMDGLQLAEKTLERHPDTRFILLSGFGEFEYARKAMQFGVRHYLLKPCSELAIIEAVREVIDGLAKREPRAARRSQYSAIVSRMLQIIDEQIASPALSLQQVAGEMLYMNPDYLGKLFKSETGEKFSSYVMKQRMEKAIELIGQSDDVKVFELAERLGFADNPPYFSQVFKKYTGFTPTEFKKRE